MRRASNFSLRGRSELFAMGDSHLSADMAKGLLACTVNCSPDPQVSARIGDLIGAESAEKPGDLSN